MISYSLVSSRVVLACLLLFCLVLSRLLWYGRVLY